MIGSFSPPCCPGLGNPLPDPFDSNVSNTLSENLGLLGIWVGSEDNFLQIRVPLVEEFVHEETFPQTPSVEGCTTEGFFPQAQAPLGENYDVQDVYDCTNYTNNHFASFQEEKEQHQDILQRYN